jgi:predicted lipoprotein with Yx(FWY)xxD motif
MQRILPVLTLALVGLVAACTGAGGSTTAPSVRPATAAPSVAASVPASVTANGPTVSASTAGYFVGPNGMSLYTFDVDAPGKSNCSGDCLANWPPLAVANAGAITVGSGLDAAAFTAITRDDGSMQVAFNSLPLYFFVGDKAPGDTKGDGVGGKWHLAMASSAPASSAPSSSPVAGASGSPAAVCKDEYNYTVPCPSAAAATVSIADAGYLAGPDGKTLYTFDRDEDGKSNCSGDCAGNWPALTTTSADDIALGDGLDDEDFATITRDDGTLQVTYYGAPLYFFIGDSAPGDTNGDGVGGVWHLAMPE